MGPVRATLAGALWGLCFYAFAATAVAVITPATLSWLLLATIPAAYAGLGAALTRRIGFNPVVLGVGWILVEIALKPLGLRYGLLAGAQGEGPLLHWVGRLLGYVFVAFVVACASASLLAALSSARRLTIPRPKSSVGLPESGRGHPSAQTFARDIRGARRSGSVSGDLGGGELNHASTTLDTIDNGRSPPCEISGGQNPSDETDDAFISLAGKTYHEHFSY